MLTQGYLRGVISKWLGTTLRYESGSYLAVPWEPSYCPLLFPEIQGYLTRHNVGSDHVLVFFGYSTDVECPPVKVFKNTHGFTVFTVDHGSVFEGRLPVRAFVVVFPHTS